MASVCADCGSYNVHSIQLRSDYGSFSAVNQNKELTNENKPYYVTGYYCEECDSTTLLKEKE